MTHEGPRSALRLVGRPDASRIATEYLDAGLATAYQPIVHLGSGAVLAYEALARPRHPEAKSPIEFFAMMERAGRRLDGERAAFTAAFGHLVDFPRVKLFVNASPTTLMDPHFDVADLLVMAERAGLAPSDLVVEVTESEAVDDLESLAQRADRLRHLGVAIAVDDAGAGHASFRVITRLRPSFIKIDRDLVHHVDQDGARHAFIEAMVRFAREIGSRLIAEGIETPAELASLAGLGVEAGQGWMLARPASDEWALPSPESRRVIAQAAQRPKLGGAQVTIGELARATVMVDAKATLAEAHARFAADPSLGLIVTTARKRVIAQLSRRVMERVVTADSWDRVADRAAVDFADRHGLTVPAELDVVDVGAILAAREREDVIEDVVVVDALGRLVGVASVRDILRSLADVRRRGERDLNPLSGLTGAGSLETALERRVMAEDNVVALWVDLNGFRRMNEVGGFELGDEVLRVFSRSLRSVTAGVPDAEAFHIGADDFILLVPSSGYEEVVSGLVRSFEHEVLPFVRTELRRRAAEWLLDHVGLSMASVDVVGCPPPGHRYTEWVEDQLAMLIAASKQQNGHSCLRASGAAVHVTNWTPEPGAQRELDLGAADPGLVLRGLDLVDHAWGLGTASGQAATPGDFPSDLPESGNSLAALHARYLVPLRDLAERALVAGTTVGLQFSGQQSDLLELLDRVALVAQRAHRTHRSPVPPEVALIDRLVRLRARRLQRTERMDRAVLGATAGL